MSDEEAPFWQRAGATVGAATLASVFASLPASIRTGAFPHAWIALTGFYVIPAIALVVLFRGAREGLRALEGSHGTARVLGALLWLGSSLVVWLRFGELLRARTHHHALAGVTFAIGSVIGMIAIAIFVARLVGWAQVERTRLAMLGAMLAIVLVILARSIPQGLAPETRAMAIDTVAAVVGLLLATTEPPRTWLKWLALLGPPLALVCFVVALAWPPILDQAPIHAWIARMR